MENSSPRKEGAKRGRNWLAWVLGVYWVALFVATHIPKPPELPAVDHGDKYLHLFAYALLGLLLSLTLAARRPFSLPVSGQAFGVLLLYAAADELLQIPVGRSCELGDLLADAAGALVAVTGVWIAAALVRRNARRASLDRA